MKDPVTQTSRIRGMMIIRTVTCVLLWPGIDTACQPKHYREDLVGKALEKLHKVQ
jgi:hypothetical protein